MLAAILPSLHVISLDTGFFQNLESLKFLRIYRILLILTMFSSVQIFTKAFTKNKRLLSIVFSVVILVILVFSLIIYKIEIQVFEEYAKAHPDMSKTEIVNSGYISNFWEALYYSTITLTTIGFGDFHAHTAIGQFITIVMSLLGVAIVAVPSGIIASSFVTEIKNSQRHKKSVKKTSQNEKDL